jgi:hypothetical protein
VGLLEWGFAMEPSAIFKGERCIIAAAHQWLREMMRGCVIG